MNLNVSETYPMNMNKTVISCVMLGAFLLPCNSVADQDKRYVDRERGVSLIVPANWTGEKFAIGPLALRIEINADGHYANCSLTVVAANQSSNTQDWLDRKINSVPMTDSEQINLVAKLQSESGDKLSNHYGTIQKLGNRNARTLFYNTTAYSSKLGANMYMESFYSFYVRPRDQVGITCLGGGLSKTAAHASFEKFNSAFQRIFSSVRFDGE